MGIKLVVTDIDGTLIDSSEKIPPQLAATVKNAGKTGSGLPYPLEGQRNWRSRL